MASVARWLSCRTTWSSAQTIVDLYRCRWGIELFFKEIKQTLQLADFLGHNANAVRWQVWTAVNPDFHRKNVGLPALYPRCGMPVERNHLMLL